ncbi:MmcQ/YjbR family DNA-binding protein [Paludicola sp. MB14-C6]|uniref:MmcQ/YjbR family DNA-binding protein n=1 Tax=Paludihabitans sp. MB14-C6 TaxID=3070656 RepID=UPI0027DE6542|nr:MmcQ/YjbR family DNA-binding protein [Paludicola sp. MB14-C6]WMJ24084.1 MmcQ/YjbR family DNA-binding protein [Paludicola sp. MB14-C6]
MTKQELIDYCLTYPSTYLDYPFDEEWAAIRHQSNKKTFAFLYHRNHQLCMNLKCNPMEADFFRSVFSAVTPAYHMNKTHWNTVTIDGSMDENQIYDLIQISYQLTKAK